MVNAVLKKLAHKLQGSKPAPLEVEFVPYPYAEMIEIMNAKLAELDKMASKRKIQSDEKSMAKIEAARYFNLSVLHHLRELAMFKSLHR